MNNTPFSLEQLAGSAGTVSLDFPPDVARMLQAEAKVHRKPVAELVRELLEDRADGREAAKVMKRIRDGKERAHPADEVYARLGI